jgi:lipid-binding SYLF domain-containing protein
MIRRRRLLLAWAALAGLALATAPAPARAESDATALLAKAQYTLESMLRDPNLKAMHAQLRRARAVLIIPNQLKAAFVIGAQGGSGVLLAKDDNGVWGYPAFFTVGTGSVGFQIGFQDSEAVLAVMTERAVSAIVFNKVKLGFDLSAAAGPVGEGVQGDTTTAAGADVVTFARNQGLFLGGSLDGAVIYKRDDFNSELYGASATPRGIIFERHFANPAADRLRAALQLLR